MLSFCILQITTTFKDCAPLVLILQLKYSLNIRQDLYLISCHDPSLINVLLLSLQIFFFLNQDWFCKFLFPEVKSAFANGNTELTDIKTIILIIRMAIFKTGL